MLPVLMQVSDGAPVQQTVARAAVQALLRRQMLQEQRRQEE